MAQVGNDPRVVIDTSAAARSEGSLRLAEKSSADISNKRRDWAAISLSD
jgi:hypothetical protein